MIKMLKRIFNWYVKSYIEVYGTVINAGINPAI